MLSNLIAPGGRYCTLVESPRFARAFAPELPRVAIGLASCLQITAEQEETWETDLNQYRPFPI